MTRSARALLSTFAILCAVSVGYLAGSFRTARTLEDNFNGYQLALNSMYLLILQQKGQTALDDRVVVQLNATIEALEKPSTLTIGCLVNSVIFGRPLLNQSFYSTYASGLKDYKNHFPAVKFSANTDRFIDHYNQKYPR
jgi:hypothetical protein